MTEESDVILLDERRSIDNKTSKLHHELVHGEEETQKEKDLQEEKEKLQEELDILKHQLELVEPPRANKRDAVKYGVAKLPEPHEWHLLPGFNSDAKRVLERIKSKRFMGIQTSKTTVTLDPSFLRRNPRFKKYDK